MKRTTLMMVLLMLTTTMSFAQYNEDGNFTVNGNVGIGTDDPEYGLEVNKTTARFSNLYPTYRWRWRAETDLSWKKIAEISLPDERYQAASMELIIFNASSNYGSSVEGQYYKFFVSAKRSKNEFNNLDTGEVSGPIADYVRLVKLATGQYEVHVRQATRWRDMEVTARQTGGFTLFSYIENPINVTSAGEIYMAEPIHIDYFTNGKFAGNVGIGTAPSSEYALAAKGTIRAKEIKVDSEVWADYVFDKDYKLLSIEQVANFINENGHLPNIPKAKTVKEEGISVGDMNAKLLEKIEELTLYVIKLKKEVEGLKEDRMQQINLKQ
ncbi:hypothetical protein EYV94_21445 [Puteibacter caeruleilacunae]|nr:hypothetical protein EYV94_21445 [Puteibacter caeruleilacunae]